MGDINQQTPELTAPATSVEVIKSVLKTAVDNRTVIDQKKAAASAVIAKIKAAIPVIKDEKQDEYLAQAIVKLNASLTDMEKLRKAYTGRVRDWLNGEIAPENALREEIASLVKMRDDRAKQMLAKANEENEKIRKQRDREIYEAEIKGKLKLNLENGIAGLLVKFEQSIDDYFMKSLRADNGPKVKSALEGMRPSIKESTWLGLIGCEYDVNRMSVEEYNALLKRARAHDKWTYEGVSAQYEREAKAILASWIEKIPQRVKELEIIAAGGDQGARVAKIVEEREAAHRKERQETAEAKASSTQMAINQEVQGEQLSSEFKAQAQEQRVEKPSGTRTTKMVLLQEPLDLVKVSKAIATIILHMIPDSRMTTEQKRKMIFAHDKSGNQILDDDGNPTYTKRVEGWLTYAETLDELSIKRIDGLIIKERIKTVAKSK